MLSAFFRPIATKFTAFLAHTRTVRGWSFINIRRMEAEIQANATKFASFVANSRKVRCTVLQKNSSNEGRVTDEKVLYSSRKGAFIIDPITTKRTFFIGHARCVVPIKCRCTDGKYFVIQVKGPLLLTDRVKTCTVSSICAVRKTCKVSGKSLQGNPRYRWETAWFSKWNSVHYWSIATKITSSVAHGRIVRGMKF